MKKHVGERSPHSFSLNLNISLTHTHFASLHLVRSAIPRTIVWFIIEKGETNF